MEKKFNMKGISHVELRFGCIHMEISLKPVAERLTTVSVLSYEVNDNMVVVVCRIRFVKKERKN